MITINNSFIIPKTKDSGIYIIFNFHNKKVYIGKTENLNRRAYQHLHNFEKGIHPHKEMLSDYQNGDLFYFSILYQNKNLDCKELTQLERIYMMSFLENGYELYNEETKEVLKCLLYQEFVEPLILNAKKKMQKKFNMPIMHISLCEKEKIDNLFGVERRMD